MRGVTAGVNPDGTSQPIEYVDITTATPEPASFLLAIPALAGLWFMRRKKAGSILCVATLGLFAGSIHAATITSEAQCSAGGNNDIGTTSCSASGFDTVQGRQIATGNSSVSYQVSGNQFQWDQRAGASDTAIAVARVNTTLSALLQTDGPLRPGRNWAFPCPKSRCLAKCLLPGGIQTDLNLDWDPVRRLFRLRWVDCFRLYQLFISSHSTVRETRASWEGFSFSKRMALRQSRSPK
jgi:hypothetical protein